MEVGSQRSEKKVPPGPLPVQLEQWTRGVQAAPTTDRRFAPRKVKLGGLSQNGYGLPAYVTLHYMA